MFWNTTRICMYVCVYVCVFTCLDVCGVLEAMRHNDGLIHIPRACIHTNMYKLLTLTRRMGELRKSDAGARARTGVHRFGVM